MKTRLLIGATTAIVATTAGLTALAAGHTVTTPLGDQPDLTPQVTISAPGRHPIKTNEPIHVVLTYKNFHADPAARCNPAGTCLGSLPNVVVGTPAVDKGHFHVYFTPAEESVDGPVQAVSFCIPTVVHEVNFSGTIEGDCPALTQPGRWRVSAEAQSDAHVSSPKAYGSPQHIPVSDSEVIKVVPG